jgi:hypothetical protein
MWDLWWTKWNWGRFSPSTSVSADNSHSAAPQSSSCIIQGWYNWPNSGRRTKWTQSHPLPKFKSQATDKQAQMESWLFLSKVTQNTVLFNIVTVCG